MTFLRSRMKSELEGVGPQDATEFIVAFLREGYYLYAIHEDDEAAGRESYAQEIYDVYMKDKLGDPVEMERMGLPTMKFMRYQAFIQFLNDDMYPDYMRQSLLNRVRIEQPETYKELEQEHQDILDRLRQQQEQEVYGPP